MCVCVCSEYYVCILCTNVLCMCCSVGTRKCNPLAVIMSQRKINRKYRKTAIEREMNTAHPRRMHYPFHRSLFPPRGDETQLYYAFLLSCIFILNIFVQFIAASILQNGVSRLWPCSRCSSSIRSLVHTLSGGQPAREFIDFLTLLAL